MNFNIPKELISNRFSGVILVRENTDILYKSTFGYRDRNRKLSNSIDTLFNIGSLDKMFTAVAIAQLVQAGKINFKNKIVQYLPNYPKEVAKKLSIHHLLTHQDGLPSYFNDKYIERKDTLDSVEKYLALFIDEPLLFKPGSKYQYSNSGFIVLGAIIESVTEKSYYDFVKENVFNIAQMENTESIHPNQNEHAAIGYTYRKPFSNRINKGERRENTEELPLKGSPAGGGYSNCEDLVRFARSLMENKLLNNELTDEILKPKVKIERKNSKTLYYGYGFQILEYDRGKFRYGHAGSFAGVNARLDIYPELDKVVVVLSNYDPPSAFKIANYIGELITS